LYDMSAGFQLKYSDVKYLVVCLSQQVEEE